MNEHREELYFDYFTNRFLKSTDIYLNPIGDLRRQLHQLWAQGIEHVEFLDERIFSSGDELVELLEELMAQGMGFLFSFTCPVRTLIRNQKLLTPLKKVGLRKITLQVVNANPDVLVRAGIQPNLDDQQYAIQLLKALRVHLHIQYTMFDPLTTVDHLATDLKFLEENKLVGIAPYADILLNYRRLGAESAEEKHDHRNEQEPGHGIAQGQRDDKSTAAGCQSIEPQLLDTAVAGQALLPYRIADRRVERIFAWLLFFDQEYGQSWKQVHDAVLQLRKELAEQRPNWIVTNQGQELMHLTLEIRRIPYQLFEALLEAAQGEVIFQVTEEQVRRQCEEALAKAHHHHHQYCDYHNLNRKMP